MAYFYQNIVRAVALRANQMDGGDAAARDAAYQSADIGATLTGVELPRHALKHSILAVGKELAAMVGNSNNPLYRGTLASVSANIASGAQIPLVDNAGNQFIGALDGFFDASDGISLTEGTKQQVDRRIANPGSFFKLPTYQFYEDGTAIKHTRTNIVAAGCSWNEATQSTAFDTLPTTPATFTFVAANVSAANDTITHAAHGLFTGMQIRALVGTGLAVLPAPLVSGTVYYAIVIDANTIKLASTLNNALTNTAINLTTAGTNGTLPNSIVTLDSYGGGVCPLPQELEVLHWCKVLAVLPEEGWFIQEANFWRQLVAEKENDIIEGKVKMMSVPSIPTKTASSEPNKD